MNITVLSSGSYTDFVLTELKNTHNPDILVFSPDIIPKLNFFDELKGKSGTFYDLCLLSESLNCVVVCGCDTDVCGSLHKSAAVIDCGRLAGISDMAYITGENGYSPGGGYRVYETARGRIGIIVGEDLYFIESARILSLCGSDIIISIFGEIKNHIPQLMMRAAAFSGGVPVCMAAKNYMQVSGADGEILCAGSAKLAEYSINIKKEYRLLQTRHRGGFINPK